MRGDAGLSRELDAVCILSDGMEADPAEDGVAVDVGRRRARFRRYVLFGSRKRVLRGRRQQSTSEYAMTPDRTNRGAVPRRPPALSSSHPPAGRPATLAHGRDDDEERGGASSILQLRPALWDPASGRFNAVRLRAAIVSRGWTVGEFAAAAGVSRACLYNALRAWSASDRTAISIATTLATREPLPALATE